MSSKNCTVCHGARFLDDEGGAAKFGFYPPRNGKKCPHCDGVGWEPEPKRVLVGGGPVTDDHRELKENGQQKDYVILSAAERAKGFIRPVRRSYVHLSCNSQTTMSQEIAETYAREPSFYSGTFCVHCRAHKPLTEFVWADNPDQQVGS